MDIRAYKTGDEAEILNLFQLSFGKNLSLEFWKWRFADNPFGPTMIELCYDRDLLIGHYAVCPVYFYCREINIPGSLSMTTMTHPQYGGRGIFSALAKSLYQRLFSQYGIQFVYGFPNVNSHYGFIKNLDWKDKEIIPTLTCSNVKFIDHNAHLLPSDKYHELVFEYDPEKITILKNNTYLTWRFKENPINKYYLFMQDCKNFIIVKKYTGSHGSEIDIMELSFEDKTENLVFLLNSVNNYFENITSYNLWKDVCSKNYILFEKVGFQPSTPLTYLGYRLLNPEIIGQSFNLDFTMSDSDIY